MNRTISAWRAILASVVVIISFSLQQAIAVEALLLQDTYVDSGTSGTPVPINTNFGTSGDLRVGKNNVRIGRTFLKFSLATLPPGTTANDVKQARLVLWVNNSTTNVGSITMTPVTSAWDESVLKNNNSLGLTFGSPKIPNLPVASAANFLSIDVTDWAKAWLNGTLINEGFQIEPGASMTLLNLFFDSKESTLTSHQPRLDIVLNSSGPQGPIGPQGPAGPQGLRGLQGLAGPAGATGGTGPTGPSGATGPTGPAGQIGATGSQGVAGVNGNKWFSGIGGPNQNIGVLFDYYLDLSNGDAWQNVSNGGGSQWSLQGNVRGPQGVAGVSGPAGSQGPPGIMGAQGPAGLQGNVGPQGIPGAIGDPGPVGPEGPVGPAAVWPNQIQPRGDLSMGEFTQGQTP